MSGKRETHSNIYILYTQTHTYIDIYAVCHLQIQTGCFKDKE